MKKFKEFNNHDLKKKIKLLETKKLSIKSNKEIEEIDKEIYLLTNLLNGIEIDNYFDVEKKAKLIDIMNINYEFLDTIKEYLPIYISYKKRLADSMNDNQIFEKSDSINDDLPYETSYTNHRIISIVHDFYNSIPDKEIRDMFNKEFKNNRKNIRFIGFDSGTSSTNYSNYKFITIGNESNFEKPIELAHEYGHLIHDDILNKVVFYDENYPFIELMSQFMEMLTIDYMNTKNNKKRATLLILNKILDLYNELYCLESYIDTKDIDFKTSKEIRNYYLKNYGRTCLNYSYLCTAELDHTYSFTKLIIFELLSMYEKDPEKALYLLKELCKLENCNYLQELEKRNIYLGESIEEYTKKLSRNIDNSIHNKSNH